MKRLLARCARLSGPNCPTGKPPPRRCAFAEILRAKNRGRARRSRRDVWRAARAAAWKSNCKARSANATSIRCVAAARCFATRKARRRPSRRSPARWPRAIARCSTARRRTRRSRFSRPADRARRRPRAAFEAALTDRQGEALIALRAKARATAGPDCQPLSRRSRNAARDDAPLDLLLSARRSICINTTAAGGNASLMSVG